jgi:mRNA interferase RelE/StbE
MKILFSRESLHYLKKLTPKIREKIYEAVSKLPDQGDVKKMRGRKIKNIYRLRVGKYRILFLLEKKEDCLKVLNVDTRGDVYK